MSEYRGMPLDVSAPIRELCDLLQLHPDYVARVEIQPDEVKVDLYRGREGRCQGPKFVVRHPGAEADPAMETLRFKVKT